ncbi:hypothetical protein B9J89_06245 [Vibrio sp. V15_P4S5T153]|nr:hypothetical protein CEG15_15855 [Vibrio anguillarum]OXX63862.1 hypothetical protein B9J89_06245 [Vibrio sp. V15_P4S5T153]
MFTSISFNVGALLILWAQSVERASLSNILYLLKVLLGEFVSFKSLVCCLKVGFVLAAYLSWLWLGLILESLNHCNCGFWSCKVSLSY